MANSIRLFIWGKLPGKELIFSGENPLSATLSAGVLPIDSCMLEKQSNWQ
jgi:hypothetical protein